MHQRIKMSNHERFQALFIVRQRENLEKISIDSSDTKTQAVDRYFKELIIDLAKPDVKLEGAVGFVVELVKYSGHFELMDELLNWQVSLHFTYIDYLCRKFIDCFL